MVNYTPYMPQTQVTVSQSSNQSKQNPDSGNTVAKTD